nr:thiopurine S-methyltransferase [Alphaproteobacteria bacterium]
AVYDRAALVALPPHMQNAYVRKLEELLPDGAVIFLISLQYSQGEIKGPPFSTPTTVIENLFAPMFDISACTQRDALETSQNLKKRGLTALTESLYVIKRRTSHAHAN